MRAILPAPASEAPLAHSTRGRSVEGQTPCPDPIAVAIPIALPAITLPNLRHPFPPASSYTATHTWYACSHVKIHLTYAVLADADDDYKGVFAIR